MPYHGPLLNFSRRTFWYLKHENRLRNGKSRKQCRNFIRKRGFWQGTVFGGKCEKSLKMAEIPNIVFFLNRFSCLRYQNVRLEKLSRGHGSAYFAIGLQSSLFFPFSSNMKIGWERKQCRNFRHFETFFRIFPQKLSPPKTVPFGRQVSKCPSQKVK